MGVLKFRQKIAAPTMMGQDFQSLDGGSLGRYQDVTIAPAQVLTLFSVPQTVLAAPGANLATILIGAMVTKPAGTAFAGLAAGSDLSLKYTGTGGLEVSQCETTGFLDQTTAQARWMRIPAAASGPNDITPVANAVIILQLLLNDITTGTSPLKLRLLYRIVPTVLP